MSKGPSNWPWPAPHDDGGVKHITAGTRLPDVELVATRGAAVNLARFQERAVVFVYPMTGRPGHANPPRWDDIPGAHGSTPEAEGFRDLQQQFELLGYEIFGVSSQSASEQREFSDRAGLSYLLLSDASFAFADALRLPHFETGGVRYQRRLTFIVRNGIIYRTIYPAHPPDTHPRDLLAELSQARS